MKDMARVIPDASERKPRTLYTLALTEGQLVALERWCDKQAWPFYSVEHARFAFKGDGVNVVGYKSGKLVVQGKKTEAFVTYVLEAEITKTPQLGYEKIQHPEWFEAHAGLDESGKGDFFGPLVVACVIADEKMVDAWLEGGLRESKKVTTDLSVFKMERLVRQTEGVVIQIAFAGMQKYNELYKRFGNLNELLAWLHARALEDALKKRFVERGLLDQFARGRLVQKYFKDSTFKLEQRTKAESDPVVAAASIVARAEYLRQLKKLSTLVDIPLLKGASSKVREQGIKLVQKVGKERLGEFAKLHFKTAEEITSLL